MICSSPKSCCYLLKCKKCPEVDSFCNKIEKLLEDHNIKTVKYKEWTTVDRYVIYFIKEKNDIIRDIIFLIL